MPDVEAKHRAVWWTGDLYRFVLALQNYRPDLNILALDAEPTGLVFVSNLDPSNNSLMEAYYAIVADMLTASLDEITVQGYFRKIEVRSTALLDQENDFSPWHKDQQTLASYFRAPSSGRGTEPSCG